MPSAKRFAYLPRTPPEKSYSARISEDFVARRAVLAVFFIGIPFPTGGGPSTNNSNRAVALDMGDNDEMLPDRPADQLNRCSRAEWSGSATEIDSGSSKAVAASAKEIPCFPKLASAFVACQVKRSGIV